MLTLLATISFASVFRYCLNLNHSLPSFIITLIFEQTFSPVVVYKAASSKLSAAKDAYSYSKSNLFLFLAHESTPNCSSIFISDLSLLPSFFRNKSCTHLLLSLLFKLLLKVLLFRAFWH